jgi:hypothetical protein
MNEACDHSYLFIPYVNESGDEIILEVARRYESISEAEGRLKQIYAEFDGSQEGTP